MCRTGHSYVKAALKESGAMLAGEMSGHIFFADRWPGFDDGLYAAARMLEIVAAGQQDCHEHFAVLPDSVSTPEINIALDHDNEQFAFMDELTRLAEFPRDQTHPCLLYTSPSPRDRQKSRMPSSA